MKHKQIEIMHLPTTEPVARCPTLSHKLPKWFLHRVIALRPLQEQGQLSRSVHDIVFAEI